MRGVYLLSRISSCRLASPRAENKSSLTLVSADRLFSKVVFLSCMACNADIRTSVLSRVSRDLSSASNLRNFQANETIYINYETHENNNKKINKLF